SSVRHPAATRPLAAAARSSGEQLRTTAVTALARFGPDGATALVGMLADPRCSAVHALVTERLIELKEPAARLPLEALAAGNIAALKALAGCAYPESFGWFAARVKAETQSAR